MAYAALLRVYCGTAEILLAYIFTGHGLHYFRACEEHVADTFGHDGEVGERG